MENLDNPAMIGPGIAVAATGVGAADLVSSSVAGAQFGMALAWAIVVGALLKFTLNEGIARWHVTTGTSVVQGWARHLGTPWLVVFLTYLVIWTVVVSGGLMVASGFRPMAMMVRAVQTAFGQWTRRASVAAPGAPSSARRSALRFVGRALLRTDALFS